MKILDIMTSRLHTEQLSLQNEMDRLLTLSNNSIVSADMTTDVISEKIDETLTKLTVNALKTRTWEGIKSKANELMNKNKPTETTEQ
jgi:hypothetical protein